MKTNKKRKLNTLLDIKKYTRICFRNTNNRKLGNLPSELTKISNDCFCLIQPTLVKLYDCSSVDNGCLHNTREYLTCKKGNKDNTDVTVTAAAFVEIPANGNKYLCVYQNDGVIFAAAEDIGTFCVEDRIDPGLKYFTYSKNSKQLIAIDESGHRVYYYTVHLKDRNNMFILDKESAYEDRLFLTSKHIYSTNGSTIKSIGICDNIETVLTTKDVTQSTDDKQHHVSTVKECEMFDVVSFVDDGTLIGISNSDDNRGDVMFVKKFNGMSTFDLSTSSESVVYICVGFLDGRIEIYSVDSFATKTEPASIVFRGSFCMKHKTPQLIKNIYFTNKTKGILYHCYDVSKKDHRLMTLTEDIEMYINK